ncbi:hypothetical protein [Streptomyces sp. NPDC015350]|uniref:hypothetical protein n=1 Tax=Streptomyces sp. NPDC015350 TaxID=3364955 RepID=UPI0036FEB50A
MRKIVIGSAAALIAALLTGCGSGSSPAANDKSSTVSVKPESGRGDVTRKVTLEVLGSGTSQIYYNLDTNKSEEVQLPWKKEAVVTLKTDAEKSVGLSVSLVPGSVAGADGMLHAAPCIITVDGKKVSDNRGGKSDKMCHYTVK